MLPNKYNNAFKSEVKNNNNNNNNNNNREKGRDIN